MSNTALLDAETDEFSTNKETRIYVLLFEGKATDWPTWKEKYLARARSSKAGRKIFIDTSDLKMDLDEYRDENGNVPDTATDTRVEKSSRTSRIESFDCTSREDVEKRSHDDVQRTTYGRYRTRLVTQYYYETEDYTSNRSRALGPTKQELKAQRSTS